MATLDVIEREPELRQHLNTAAARINRTLERMGYKIGPTQSAMAPVIVGDRIRLFRF